MLFTALAFASTFTVRILFQDTQREKFPYSTSSTSESFVTTIHLLLQLHELFGCAHP